MSMLSLPIDRTLGPSGAPLISVSKLLSIVLTIFLLYIFVDGKPFVDLREEDAETLFTTLEQGDVTKQIFYISTFLIVAILSIRGRIVYFVSKYPPTLVLLLIWIMVSCLWAVDSFVSLKRSLLAFFVAMIVLNSVIYLGVDRTLKVVYASLTILLACNFLSVALLPGLAIHGASSIDAALAGAWRGVMPHKNHASAISAISIILYGYLAVTRRSWIDAFLMFASFVFLIGTKGKTSLGFVLPCLLFSLSYYYMFGVEKGRGILINAGVIFIGILIVLAVVFMQKIEAVFSDPTSFTGRVEIWTVVFNYAKDHPFLGSGYGAFWQIGEFSPVIKIATNQWLLSIAHSHNGYLEVLATTGYPGFVLAIYVCVIRPLFILFSISSEHRRSVGLIAGIWLFAVLYNLLETHLLTRDRQIWIFLLVAIQSLHLYYLDDKRVASESKVARIRRA